MGAGFCNRFFAVHVFKQDATGEAVVLSLCDSCEAQQVLCTGKSVAVGEDVCFVDAIFREND